MGTLVMTVDRGGVAVKEVDGAACRPVLVVTHAGAMELYALLDGNLKEIRKHERVRLQAARAEVIAQRDKVERELANLAARIVDLAD